MVYGRLTTCLVKAGLALALLGQGLGYAQDAPPVRAGQTAVCSKPLYLTFDTGHMGVAQAIADTLDQYQVKATFFAANERTKVGLGSLSDDWQAYWRQLNAKGHKLASHTYDHWVWRADTGEAGFQVQPTAGSQSGQKLVVTADAYCAQLKQVSRRFQDMTGNPGLPLFRAPGGKTSARLLAEAKSCGYLHVPWSPAGFLGDELPSDKYPNTLLLRQALNHLKPGDIMLAHLGIWSRQDPWAPAVLEPLLKGLIDKGFCFQTLDQHPHYQAWVQLKALAEPKSIR